MTTIEIRRALPCRPDDAFAYLLDIEAYPAWLEPCRSVVIESGEAGAEGSAYDLVFGLATLQDHISLRLCDVDHDARSYRLERCTPGTHLELAVGVSSDAGCTLTFVVEHGFSGRLLGLPVGGRLFGSVFTRSFDQSMPHLVRGVGDARPTPGGRS